MSTSDTGSLSAALGEQIRAIDESAARGWDDLREEEHLPLLMARASAGEALRGCKPDRPAWPPPYPDSFGPTAQLPEIPADQLTASAIGAGVLHHGALLVRGLLTTDTATRVRHAIDQAFEAYAEWADAPDQREACGPWFHPFEPRIEPGAHAGYGQYFLRAADSAATASLLIDAYKPHLDLPLREYFGGRPVLASSKWTIRYTPLGVGGAFHQDGRFMKGRIQTVNVWVALTDCGVDAPGLDVVPKRMDAFHGDCPPPFDFCLTEETVARVAAPEGIAKPTYRAGDAIIFDEYTIHSIGLRDNLVRGRYALETWFFHPSSFPEWDTNRPILF